MIHASLLDYLARAPAKVVVYDVIFAERDRRSFKVGEETWTGEESDRALAEATAKAGNVVHVVDVAAEAGGAAQEPLEATPYRLDDRVEARAVATPPFPELAKASRALGHNLVVVDPDGPVRRADPVRARRRPVPAVAAVRGRDHRPRTCRASGVTIGGSALRVGDRAVPLIEAELPSYDGAPHSSLRTLIRYPGGVLDPRTKRPTYADYSFYDLFYSEQQILAGEKPLVDPARFKDAVVIVGTTAPGLYDLIPVPFSEGKMPGMQIHASVLDSVLSGRFMQPAPGVGRRGRRCSCARSSPASG